MTLGCPSVLGLSITCTLPLPRLHSMHCLAAYSTHMPVLHCERVAGSFCCTNIMSCAVSIPSAFLFGTSVAPHLLQFLSAEHAVTGMDSSVFTARVHTGYFSPNLLLKKPMRWT
jgi:hypothetical protein